MLGNTDIAAQSHVLGLKNGRLLAADVLPKAGIKSWHSGTGFQNLKRTENKQMLVLRTL